MWGHRVNLFRVDLLLGVWLEQLHMSCEFRRTASHGRLMANGVRQGKAVDVLPGISRVCSRMGLCGATRAVLKSCWLSGSLWPESLQLLQIEDNAEQPLRITRISVAATFDAAAATHAGQQCLQAFLSGNAAPGASPPKPPAATQSPEAKLQAFFQAGASPPSRRTLPFSSTSPPARPRPPIDHPPSSELCVPRDGPSTLPPAMVGSCHPGEPGPTPLPEPHAERPPNADPVPCERAKVTAGDSETHKLAGPHMDRGAAVPTIPATDCGSGERVSDAAPPRPSKETALGTPCGTIDASAECCHPPGSQHRPAPAPSSESTPVPAPSPHQAAADADPSAATTSRANDDGDARAAAPDTVQPAASASPGRNTATDTQGRPGEPVQATHAVHAAAAAVQRAGGCLAEQRPLPAASPPTSNCGPDTGAAGSPDSRTTRAAQPHDHTPRATADSPASPSAARDSPTAFPPDLPSQDRACPPEDTSTPEAGPSSPVQAATAPEQSQDRCVEAGDAGAGGCDVGGGSGSGGGSVAAAVQGQEAVLEDALRRAHAASLCGDRHDLDRRLALRLQEDELRACKRAKAPAGKAATAATRGGKGAALCLLS